MPFFDIGVAVLLLMAAPWGLGDTGRVPAALTSVATPSAPAQLYSAIPMPSVPVTTADVTTADVIIDALTSFDTAAWDLSTIGAVDHNVFSLALDSAERAVARGQATPSTLTVIDFSVASTERRMFVYDLRSRALLFVEHVSHGRNSGANVPTMFSNQPESFKSSIGLYRTAEGYVGKHGYSLRLDGLEKGFNDRARERAIVIHGADYVNGTTAKAQGRLGRSLGCPAVRPQVARKLIDTIKDGGLVFAYYPDDQWLTSSTYLN